MNFSRSTDGFLCTVVWKFRFQAVLAGLVFRAFVFFLFFGDKMHFQLLVRFASKIIFYCFICFAVCWLMSVSCSFGIQKRTRGACLARDIVWGRWNLFQRLTFWYFDCFSAANSEVIALDAAPMPWSLAYRGTNQTLKCARIERQRGAARLNSSRRKFVKIIFMLAVNLNICTTFSQQQHISLSLCITLHSSTQKNHVNKFRFFASSLQPLSTWALEITIQTPSRRRKN